MQDNLLTRNLQGPLQSLYQPDQVTNLAVCEDVAVAIAHQTNADGSLVVVSPRVSNDMGTGQLAGPSIAHMDFAVAKAIAVADNKVVAEPLIAPRQVLAVNGLGRAEGIAKMVNDDAIPAGFIQRGVQPEKWVFCCSGPVFQRRD